MYENTSKWLLWNQNATFLCWNRVFMFSFKVYNNALFKEGITLETFNFTPDNLSICSYKSSQISKTSASLIINLLMKKGSDLLVLYCKMGSGLNKAIQQRRSIIYSSKHIIIRIGDHRPHVHICINIIVYSNINQLENRSSEWKFSKTKAANG